MSEPLIFAPIKRHEQIVHGITMKTTSAEHGHEDNARIGASVKDLPVTSRNMSLKSQKKLLIYFENCWIFYK